MPTADERTALLAPERETKRPLTPTKKYLIVTTTLLSGFLSTLDLTIVATCIPTISSELQVSNQEAWIGTAYLWSSVTFTPLYGRLSDLIGRKPAYLQAVVLFTIGTAACGFAPTFTTLVVARFVAGMGGGGMGTVASVITADTFSPAERGFYQGLSFAMFGAGMGLGGPIGGFLTQYFGWRAAFYSQLPLAAITVLMILLSVPTAETHQSISLSSLAQIDFGGALTLLISVREALRSLANCKDWRFVATAVYRSWIRASQGQCRGNRHGSHLRGRLHRFPLHRDSGGGETGPPPLDATTPHTIMRGHHLLNDSHRQLQYAVSPANGVRNRFSAKPGIGWGAPPAELRTPPKASLHCAEAFQIAMTISAPIAGYIVKRTSRYKWLIVISCAGPLVAMILISQLTPQSWEPLQWICFSSLLTLTLSTCLTLSQMLIYSAAILNSVEKHEIATATGFVFVWRSVGQVFGVGLSSAILQNSLSAQLHRRFKSAKIVNRLLRASKAINDLPHEAQRSTARQAYAIALRNTFYFALAGAAIVLVTSIFIPNRSLNKEVPRAEQSRPVPESDPGVVDS